MVVSKRLIIDVRESTARGIWRSLEQCLGESRREWMEYTEHGQNTELVHYKRKRKGMRKSVSRGDQERGAREKRTMRACSQNSKAIRKQAVWERESHLFFQV